jgi:glutamate---cysteine ligase / carboxylate-amine ligase
VIEENRFLAARDGIAAELVDPTIDARVPAAEQLAALFESCAEHAMVLDSQAELEVAAVLATRPGAQHQRELASANGLEGVLPELSRAFLDPATLAGEAAALLAMPRP